MAIAKLDPHLINQIAAGEVVERPASVVKELVENSLDAQARTITIEIEQGGTRRIAITDDGQGIAYDDLPHALESHATSKIRQVEDLAAIRTMGFRGEAIASIASIARMTIRSRAADADTGGQITCEGRDITAPQPIGCAVGTVIDVCDLFFNTPARRKFLRNPSTEFTHISETVSRLAMAHPDIGFILKHNDRTTLDLPPNQNLRERCLDVLGKQLDEGMLEIEHDEAGIALWGMISQPSLAKATAKYQHFFVNGRTIRDRNITHALKEAYRGLIEPTRQPMAVLMLRLDPDQVDVNVHPTKAEVRFAQVNRVHGLVLNAIRQRLLGSDLTPAVAPPGSQSMPNSFTLQSLGGDAQQSSFSFEPPDAVRESDQPLSDSEGSQRGIAQFVDYFKRLDPRSKSLAYQQVREALSDDETDDEASLPASSPSRLLQVHDSFIVTQDDQGIVIVDQHALHERVMFQTLLSRVEQAGQLESQRLLTPVMLHVDAGLMDTAEALQPLLDKLGIELSVMGPSSLGVQSFASLLFERGVEVEPFVRDLLERASEEDFRPSSEQALHEVLDMMSCKAAVKAGDHMSREELQALLDRRDEIERASNCPHGRPTTIRLTIKDLHKHFKRS